MTDKVAKKYKVSFDSDKVELHLINLRMGMALHLSNFNIEHKDFENNFFSASSTFDDPKIILDIHLSILEIGLIEVLIYNKNYETVKESVFDSVSDLVMSKFEFIIRSREENNISIMERLKLKAITFVAISIIVLFFVLLMFLVS